MFDLKQTSSTSEAEAGSCHKLEVSWGCIMIPRPTSATVRRCLKNGGGCVCEQIAFPEDPLFVPSTEVRLLTTDCPAPAPDVSVSGLLMHHK